MALENNGTVHCSENLRMKIDEWLKWDQVSKFPIFFCFLHFVVLINERKIFFFRMRKLEMKFNSWTSSTITRN